MLRIADDILVADPYALWAAEMISEVEEYLGKWARFQGSPFWVE